MAKTRGNGRGGLFPERKGGKPTGRYIVQIVIGHTPKGYRYKRQVVSNKSDGEKLLRRLIADLEAGRLDHAKSPALSTYADQWLAKVATSKEPKTYQAYRWVMRDHVLPILGKKKLDVIRRRDIRLMIDAIAKKGVGPTTQKHAVRVLHTLFQEAINDEYASENPASGVKVASADATQRETLSEPEIEALVNVGLVDSPIREIVLFMLATGTRVGEACGVRWANERSDRELDLDALTVTVSGQLQRVGGKLIRKRTKTNQYRVLAIPAWLGETLRELRSRYMIEGISDPDGLVFLSPSGTRIDPKWLWKYLQLACDAASIKRISAHVLRHTFATIGMAKTGNLHAVQKALGHSQVALTSNLYAHASLEASKQVSDAMGDVIKKRE